MSGLVKANSNLINIEVIKFFKAIIKSKDPVYIQYIIHKNLFGAVNTIFVESYKKKNPPMVFSIVRQLFDLIFT